MAITYVGGNSLGQAGVTATTDITISLTALTGGSDSAAAAGDLVIVALGVGDTDAVDGAMTETSGTYTEVADLYSGSATASEANLGVFYKFLTGADASVSVRSNLGNDAGISVAVMVFRGVKTVASGGPFDVTSTTATGTGTGAIDPPSIDTTGTAGIWTVIAGTRAIGTGTNTLTGPTGYTTDFVSAPFGDDTVDAITGMGYNSAPSDPENPGTIVWAGTEAAGDGWCAVTMALAPAAEAVSVGISGNAGTSGLGSLAAAVVIALSGVAGTGAVGTLAPSASTAIVGNAATGAVGTVTPSTSYSVALAGNGGTGAVGSLGATVSRVLSGNAGTGSPGTFGVTVSRALSGNAGTGAVGTLVPTAGSSVALSGNAGTGAAGSLGVTVVRAATGNVGTGAAGSLGVAVSVVLGGNAATSSAGNLGVTISAPLSGNVGTGAVGTLTPTVAGGPITVALSGVEATGSVGTLGYDVNRWSAGAPSSGPFPTGRRRSRPV